jgi:outer membrane protein
MNIVRNLLTPRWGLGLPLASALALSLSSSPAAAQPAAPAQPATPAQPAATLPENDGEAVLRRLNAVPGGLTSADVAKRAVASSPELTARRANADAAKAKEDAATAGFWPKLAGSARYTRMSKVDPLALPGGIVPANEADRTPGVLAPGTPLMVTPGFPFPVFENNGAVTGTLSIPVSDYLLRLSRATGAAERTTRAAQKEAEAARRKVAADARIAYYDWIRARGQVMVVEDRLRAVEEQSKDVKKMFDAGFASKADVLRGESQRTSLGLMVTRGRNGAALAEEALRVAMHDRGRGGYQVGENLLVAPAPVPGLNDAEALGKEAREKRPELAVLAETEKALRDLEVLAQIGRYPRLDLTGSVQYSNPNQRIFPPRQKWDMTWDASVVLSWSPTDIPAANATSREQAARANELAARRDQLLDGIRLELQQASSAITEADAAIASTQQALGAAEEGYRVRRELFRAGKATLVEVIDAEAELTRSRLEVVNALVEARIARVRFDHAVGRDG